MANALTENSLVEDVGKRICLQPQHPWRDLRKRARAFLLSGRKMDISEKHHHHETYQQRVQTKNQTNRSFGKINKLLKAPCFYLPNKGITLKAQSSWKGMAQPTFLQKICKKHLTLSGFSFNSTTQQTR